MCENEKKYKSVTDPRAARPLIKKGYRVCDIKPKKEDKNASIFIFEATEEFMKDLSDMLNSLKKSEA